MFEYIYIYFKSQSEISEKKLQGKREICLLDVKRQYIAADCSFIKNDSNDRLRIYFTVILQYFI